ncbi:hypothetical protein SUGI_0073770 [Cryptomeria japonica]|uniref:scopoletin glucosyltransferase-like n=1 Tax=Cryptomeria japonica TaxID=3369 RepID=UPI002408E741|nr:scopoletin glucosyltransferase-like [Cryptomeria japonica]GLJ07765.1 hypothetical protein SUGI_0073770 [Cryptomeria japonica]
MDLQQKPHVVMVPYPAMGHCIPSLDLVKLLASHSLTVTYVTTHTIAQRLKGPVDEARKAAGLDIHLVGLCPPKGIEGLPEGRESMDLVSSKYSLDIISLVESLEQPFDGWFQQQGSRRPVCIISDMFIDWTVRSSERHNIPRVVFYAMGAFPTSIFHAVCSSISTNTLRKEGDSVIVDNIPSSPLTFTKDQIPARYFNPDSADPMLKFVTGKMQSITKCWGVLVNTFDDLETRYLQHLKNTISGRPLWSVGPVLPSEGSSHTRGKMADISEEKLLQWLDSQSPSSVLYVSFGSQAFLSQEQTKALARGLEASDQAFIWSIKISPETAPIALNMEDSHAAYLPEGFMERTKGLIIWGWAPQLLILSHPSVSGFLSHCGWNSVLESIMMGVPLVTWPMFSDQHFNSKLVTEELGIGVQFCQHMDEVPNEEKVEMAVRLVMGSEQGKQMRKRAQELKELAKQSVGGGGSSASNLQAFACEIHKLMNCNPQNRNDNGDSVSG